MQPTARTRALIPAILLTFVVGTVALTGCSLVGEPDYTTITEGSGLFHVKIPSDWSGRSEDGLIAVAASADLPTEVDTIDRFWLLIYPSTEASEAPASDTLATLVRARADARQWQDADYGSAEETEVGSRPAVVMTASGATVAGVPFEGRYYLVRTRGRDTIISAIAPAGDFEAYADELDAIVSERWFWHGAATSDEASSTETP